MKKILFALFTTVAVVSCSKSTIENTTQKAPECIISGGFEATKTAVTSLSGQTSKVVWTTGDEIGILSKENHNAKAELDDACNGELNGSFIPKDAIPYGSTEVVTFSYPESGTSDFIIYYPYNDAASLDLDSGIVTSSIEENQDQDALGDLSLGRYGFSYGVTTVSSEEMKVNFTLSHAMAYVCFKAQYGDADGFRLSSIQLADMSNTYPLSGQFRFDTKNRVIEPVDEGAKYSVKAQVLDQDFSVSPSAEELYLTLFPADYTKINLKVIVSFVNKDGRTVTIPMDLEKGWKLEGGTCSIINLGTIHKSDCNIPWYEVEEVRDLVGGWAYGPQNTYFLESKAPGEGTSSVTINVKARGDFAKVKEPVYYGLLVNRSDVSSRFFVILPDGTDEQDPFVDGRFVPNENHVIGPDYNITIDGYDQKTAGGTIATLAIYDKDKNLLWSYMLQRWRSNDPPVAIDYPEIGVKILDRALGQANGNANLSGNLNHYAAYFQWGRKDPFAYAFQAISHWAMAECSAESSIDYSISHPYLMFYSKGAYNNWAGKDFKIGLWGGKNNTKDWFDPDYVGHKTIYDPCPEGYRVCDSRVLAEVSKRAERWERSTIIAKYHTGVDNAYNHDTGWGGSELMYNFSSKRDYWIYGGLHFDSPGVLDKTPTSSDSGYAYWGNAVCLADGKPGCLCGYYTNSWNVMTTAGPNTAMAVRCQKED